MDAKAQFGLISKNYDSQRRMFVPRFDEFYGAAAGCVSPNSKELRGADIGAGTGILAQKILEIFPNAKIRLSDISSEMLDVAKKRFAGRANIEFEIENFADFGGTNEFDFVASALAVHHIPDGEKFDLYRRIFKALKNGGTFVNAEQVLCESPEKIAEAKAERDKIIDENLSAKDAQIARNRLALDKCATASAQLEMLKQIGFEDVRIVFKHLDFAVIAAKKQLRYAPVGSESSCNLIREI